MRLDYGCPHCEKTFSIELVHMYEHVRDCPVCAEVAIDFIFTEFVKDGFTVPTSFIRQALRYFEAYLKSGETIGEEEHDSTNKN